MIQLALATTRPRRAVPGRGVLDPSVTRMRVRLGDLDFYRHVNNGVYLTMMDVGRANFMADLGAFGLLRERGWYPVVAASTMTYRRSLMLGQRFEISTRVLGWDARVVYLEQTFTRGGGAHRPRSRRRPLPLHPWRPCPGARCRRPAGRTGDREPEAAGGRCRVGPSGRCRCALATARSAAPHAGERRCRPRGGGMSAQFREPPAARFETDRTTATRRRPRRRADGKEPCQEDGQSTEDGVDELTAA